MTKPLPHFKYHPDPIATEMIVKKPGTCSCCGQAVDHLYDGPTNLRSLDRPEAPDEATESICPWCIADGSAAEKLNIEFTSQRPIGNADVQAELELRTPSYFAWQEEEWLSHCGDFCAYLGRAGEKEITPLRPAIDAELQTAAAQMRMTIEEFFQWVHKDGNMTAYLFQCLHCSAYRMYTDAN